MSLYETTNILGRIERAATARQRYVLANAGTVDSQVDHVLCTHISFLADIAYGQTCTEEQVHDAINRGAVIAAAEVQLKL